MITTDKDGKDKRAIDNPGLNQDATYDKKDDSDFDESDDFHKNDDTTKDAFKDKSVAKDGTSFTGEITI